MIGNGLNCFECFIAIIILIDRFCFLWFDC